MISTIIAGIVGVFVGVVVERLVQRHGRLRFVAGEIRLLVEGDEISEETVGGYLISRALHPPVKDIELLYGTEWLMYSFDLRFFNEKEVQIGLRDVAITFSSGDRREPLEIVLPIGHVSYNPGARPSYESLSEINFPSREWISMHVGGTVHDSAYQDEILAFEKVTQAAFRGYFPNGREFRRELEIAN